jgi:UMF1 family MFS transporter
MVTDSETGRTMLGLQPLMALDVNTHEGMRAIGPFSALWFLVFALPLFLFTPDRLGARAPTRNPVREGLRQLRETIAHVRRYADILRFLLARMLYVDGLGAIFAFGGLYAAAIFDWGSTELGLFGVLLTVAGAAGAFAGGWLDDRFGSRAVIIFTLAGLIVAALGVVSVDADTILFAIDVAPAHAGAAPFASASERVYLAFAIVVGLMAGPLQASSRTYLARLAPPEMMTEFFGLYAFSGKITAFAAPLLVGLVTALTANQRAGIAVILLFLLAGLALMITAPRVTTRGAES